MESEKEMKNVGILIFDQVEELDFIGPLEVFGLLQRMKPETITVFTVTTDGKPIRCAFQLQVIPEFSFANCPATEILVVPGGRGARTAMHNAETLEFMRTRASKIDMAFYVIELLYGNAIRDEVAKRMEYRLA
jgi:cyclohexyl-isocyanide hydratase